MKSSQNLSGRAYVAIGLMLFALFFGAGNLIFPAALGQQAGVNVWWAIIGFILTGVGLPLLGVLAMGHSGCKNTDELAGRVHPWYGRIYTVLLYLAIGPMFAIPRTGTVSYEISVKPFLDASMYSLETWFLLLFFLISLWLSINPAKLVNRIGKVLTPLLLCAILLLIVKSLISPMGSYDVAQEAYATPMIATVQGFLDGYNTMDALASLVFAILVIDFVKLSGATSREEITASTMKAGMIAVGLLGFVYIFIGNIGATSVGQLGLLETGAPVLAESAKYFFGNLGAVILAVIVLLACLTTSIGLITSCASYFHQIYGRIGYKTYAVIFTIASFVVSMYGLKTIISAAIPILMLLYPLTIVLIFLALAHNIFGGRRCVYTVTMAFTLISGVVSGLETAGFAPATVEFLFKEYVPLHSVGMDWLPLAIVGFIIGLIVKAMTNGTDCGNERRAN
ncbi:branched-chain amino acid transporter II carrier protein [Veillonella montpellierensis DNF00314]|uniref:Branched-chain amino acid transport system carrier protein n=1 Tax=Veillonella montpellierensis DNF00314 TaxID=1401067 RepID=A0A096AK36_9FIRM|nr:branched-chain amino acid transport system II carrier protein [Veillonella montpellierensis]KGF47195.1 branched-chain amino acid transporter II carrier protein [Veillonella montpellierensis DNF00314]